MITLRSKILKDEYTELCNSFFDVEVKDYSVTSIEDNLILPNDWKIGVIYGSSGSGKTTILKEHFGQPFTYEWDKEKAIISNFTCVSPKKASRILCSVGLSSVPVWLRPYNCLSNGEKFRADMAIAIAMNDLIVIDEYTSVVNRKVAISMSNTIQRYIRKKKKKLVVSSCHKDILKVLKPDWIYSTNTCETLYDAERYSHINNYSINNCIIGSKIGELIIE